MRHWMIALMLAAAGPAAAQMAAPTAEAEALGRRIAAHGTLAALLPMMAAKETESLVAEHPDLDAAGKAKLRAAADATRRAATDRLIAAVGRQYAMRLSLADLRAMAAFGDSPAAAHWRAAEPAVIAETANALAGFDFKKDAWAAYCATSGTNCAKPK